MHKAEPSAAVANADVVGNPFVAVDDNADVVDTLSVSVAADADADADVVDTPSMSLSAYDAVNIPSVFFYAVVDTSSNWDFYSPQYSW